VNRSKRRYRVRQRESVWWGNVKRALFLIVPAIPFAVWVGWRAPKNGEGYFQFLRYHSLELLAIELAISGIAYAWHHDDKLDKQVAQLRDQAQRLRMLEGSLSTHRRGPFPRYLQDIGKLAGTAKKNDHVDILVDSLDYGSFFKPSIHQQVHRAIRAAARRGVKIRILVCADPPEPFTGPSGQRLSAEDKNSADLLSDYCSALGSDSEFKRFVGWLRSADSVFDRFSNDWFKDDWFKGPQKKPDAEILDKCAEVCEGKRRLSVGDGDDLLLKTLLQIRQLWFAIDLQKCCVDVRGLSGSEPMFFWIKYKEEPGKEITDDGLFTFANAARGAGQLGYVTHDEDLLSTFGTIFNEMWDDPTKTSPDPKWLEFLRTLP
jgi:hypothetical protein